MSKAREWGNVMAAPLPKALEDAIDQAKRATTPPKEKGPAPFTRPIQIWLTPRAIKKLKIDAIDKGTTMTGLVEQLLREAGYGD